MNLVTWPTPGRHPVTSTYRVTPTFVPGMIWWWGTDRIEENRLSVWLEVDPVTMVKWPEHPAMDWQALSLDHGWRGQGLAWMWEGPSESWWLEVEL